MRLRGFTAAAILVAGALTLHAPAGRAAPAYGPRLILATGIGAGYDSNLLQYSDEQLQLFESGTRPDEFSIQTRDDAVWTPFLALTLEQRRSGSRRRSLRLRGDGDFHAKNSTADYHSVGAVWREGLGGGRRLQLSYYLLPNYYLRQLFDATAIVPYRGLSKYRRAELRLQIAGANWSQRLGHSGVLSGDYRFEHRRYNPAFDERTSGTSQAVGQFVFDRLPHHGSVLVNAGYRTCNARAGDTIDPATGSPVLNADVGYHGLVTRLAGSTELARRRGLQLNATIAYELETRDFTSAVPTDRYHYRRKDLLNAGEAEVRLGLRRHWTIRGTGRTEFNRAKLGVALPATSSGDAGSYRESQAALAIEWSGNLWRGDRAGNSGDEP